MQLVDDLSRSLVAFDQESAVIVFEIALSRPDIMRGEGRPISRLLGADGGLQLLMHVLARQSTSLSTMMGATPFSHAACARHARISRVQVQRLVSMAEESGLLRLHRPGWLVPQPQLLDNVAWLLAANLQILRICAEALGRRQGSAARP